jgi:hypothetical protein
MTELPEPLRLANWLEQAAGASSVYRDKAAAELRRMHRELQRLTQLQTQPCAGRNCGSTNPKLHSAECFEDYEKSTGLAQPEQEPVAWRITDGEGDYEYCTDLPEDWSIQWSARYGRKYEPLYTAPPQRKPLTDEEIEDLYFDKFSMGELKAFARAIEAAHGIGEQA